MSVVIFNAVKKYCNLTWFYIHEQSYKNIDLKVLLDCDLVKYKITVFSYLNFKKNTYISRLA